MNNNPIALGKPSNVFLYGQTILVQAAPTAQDADFSSWDATTQNDTITLINDMVSTLIQPNTTGTYSLAGWGLAANQISPVSGVASTAVFIVIPSGGCDMLAFINPTVTYGNWYNNTVCVEEMCMSFPGLTYQNKKCLPIYRNMNFTLTANVIHYKINSNGSYSICEFIPNLNMNGLDVSTTIGSYTLQNENYGLLLHEADHLIGKLFVSYLIPAYQGISAPNKVSQNDYTYLSHQYLTISQTSQVTTTYLTTPPKGNQN